MAGQSPKLYDIKKTTVAFAVAGIVLFVGLVAMILQDSTREWKGWQRKFMALTKENAQKELEAAKKAVDQNKLEQFHKDLNQAEQDVKSRHKEYSALQLEIQKLEVDHLKAKNHFQDLKQFQDSDRYYFEEYRHKGEERLAASYEKKIERRKEFIHTAKLKVEELEALIESKQSELAKFSEKEEAAKREITKLTSEINRIEAKIKKNTPNLAYFLLNAPMLDFLKPTLQIQQIVLEKLEDDFYFAKSKKVDRCITCHLGIDQKGFENAEGPFKTHPRLDLFLGADSPHPMEKFGCTTCHGGSGHSVSFKTAAHTPKNDKQAEEWKKKYHWKEMKHWSEKMLPLQHIEASCAKCHQGSAEVPQAPKLNEGRKLAETFGCFNCHKVEGFERWKVGPSLLNVQSKLEADWIIRWLQNPKEFRPSTKMPRIFHLSNTSDAASMEKSNVAIAGISAYLSKNSDAVTLETPKVKGNAENGKKLVSEIGCLGCHTADGNSANDFGPELVGLGSKVKEEWLFTWLKNPKHYSPATRMPDLRLSDQEAADITAHLMASKNEKFDSLRPPHIKPESVDGLAAEYLKGKMREKEIKETIEKMAPEERLEFVGKQAIAHQGCYGCHDIKGFESSKNIGTELTHEGSKELSKFDFGFTDIHHSRQAWIFQKLKEPRIFNHGKDFPYLEKLKMPQFDFTDQQAEAITTFVISLVNTKIPLEMQKQLTAKEREIETGRITVSKFNCQGCHTMDGKDGAVRSIIEDPGNAPPVIIGEGAKVQSEWLYQFLHAPTTIRPWLKYRMPTFGFQESQINALIKYFNNLDNVDPTFAEFEVKATADEMAVGKKLFEDLQCVKCHKSNPEPGLTASFLAPDLALSKKRLRPEWVVEWIKDPQVLLPGTMMPTFFSEGQSPFPDIMEGDYVKQSVAIRNYLWVFNPVPEQSAASNTVSPQTVS